VRIPNKTWENHNTVPINQASVQINFALHWNAILGTI